MRDIKAHSASFPIHLRAGDTLMLNGRPMAVDITISFRTPSDLLKIY